MQLEQLSSSTIALKSNLRIRLLKLNNGGRVLISLGSSTTPHCQGNLFTTYPSHTLSNFPPAPISVTCTDVIFPPLWVGSIPTYIKIQFYFGCEAWRNKTKEIIIHPSSSMLFLLFYSPKPRHQVRKMANW